MTTLSYCEMDVSQKRVPPNAMCSFIIYHCFIYCVYLIYLSQPECPKWQMGHPPSLGKPKSKSGSKMIQTSLSQSFKVPSFLMSTSSKNLGSISPSCGVSLRSTFLGKPSIAKYHDLNFNISQHFSNCQWPGIVILSNTIWISRFLQQKWVLLLSPQLT